MSKCQSLRSTDVSPIFLGITKGLADLRAQGCKQDSGCKLYVDSDGEENVDKEIKQALKGELSARHGLPARADNNGIRVIFCGLAAMSSNLDSSHSQASQRNSGRDDRLRRTWRSLFSVPEIVDFEPYCPIPANSNPDLLKSADTKSGRPR